MKRTAKELYTTLPGAWARHQAYILALCGGVIMTEDPSGLAKRIVKCADTILEETEQ